MISYALIAEHYDDSLNCSSVYQNFNVLAEQDLIEKGQHTDRTNTYGTSVFT